MRPFYERPNRLYPWFRAYRKLYNTMWIIPLKSLNRLYAIQQALAHKVISVDKLFAATDNWRDVYLSEKRNDRRIF
jgi:hypothetical protein